jgi:DNA-binding protein HU-beta
MNKSELVTKIAEITTFTKKEVNIVITAFIELIIITVAKRENVKLTGFGSFKLRSIKGRNGINPVTKQRIWIPASTKPTFLAGKFFKDKISLSN